MKKQLLLAAACSIGLMASAQSVADLTFFSHQFDDNSGLAPFTTWCEPYTPAAAVSQFFDGIGWSLLTMNNGHTYASSCSSFADDNQVADAGLVTRSRYITSIRHTRILQMRLRYTYPPRVIPRKTS